MTLPVNAYRVIDPPQDNCGVCLQSLQNGEEAFDHEGVFVNRHMMHKKCMQEMFSITKGLCSHCKVPINEYSLYSLTERVTIRRIAFKNNALLGMAKALVLGSAIHAFLPQYVAKLLVLGLVSSIGCSLFAYGWMLSLNIHFREVNDHAVMMGMMVGALSGLIPRSVFINPSLPLVLSTIAMVGALTSGSIAYQRRWE